MSLICASRFFIAPSLQIHAALFAHFVATAFICPTVAPFSYTLNFLVFFCNDKVISLSVALILMKRTVWPFLHVIEFFLPTKCNGPSGKVNVTKRIWDIIFFHLKGFVRNTDTSVCLVRITVDRIYSLDFSFQGIVEKK